MLPFTPVISAAGVISQRNSDNDADHNYPGAGALTLQASVRLSADTPFVMRRRDRVILNDREIE
jgi:hypothetical protein